MSIIEATPKHIINVCTCGFEAKFTYDQVLLGKTSVGVPRCEHCGTQTFMFAQDYEDEWEELDEAALMRYVMGQYAHFFAAKSDKAIVSDPDKTAQGIFELAESEGRYELVKEGATLFKCEVHPAKKMAFDQFKKTGKVTLQKARKKEPTKFGLIKDRVEAYRGKAD